MAEEQEVLEDEGVEVEVEATEEPAGQEVVEEPESQEQESAAESGDDELDSYSNKVQARIKKLT